MPGGAVKVTADLRDFRWRLIHEAKVGCWGWNLSWSQIFNKCMLCAEYKAQQGYLLFSMEYLYAVIVLANRLFQTVLKLMMERHCITNGFSKELQCKNTYEQNQVSVRRESKHPPLQKNQTNWAFLVTQRVHYSHNFWYL